MTLLEKAKDARTIRKSKKIVTKEEVELALAYFDGFVQRQQVMIALKITKNAYVYQAMTYIILAGYKQGLLEIKLK